MQDIFYGVRRGGAGLSATIFLLAMAYNKIIHYDKPIKRISTAIPSRKAPIPGPSPHGGRECLRQHEPTLCNDTEILFTSYIIKAVVVRKQFPPPWEGVRGRPLSSIHFLYPFNHAIHKYLLVVPHGKMAAIRAIQIAPVFN